MQSTSSIPPRVSPFPARGSAIHCYITGDLFGPKDKVVMIPVTDGDEESSRPAKLYALFEALGLITEEEQYQFYRNFVGHHHGKPPELMWYKLSRHKPPLFRLLLSKLGLR